MKTFLEFLEEKDPTMAEGWRDMMKAGLLAAPFMASAGAGEAEAGPRAKWLRGQPAAKVSPADRPGDPFGLGGKGLGVERKGVSFPLKADNIVGADPSKSHSEYVGKTVNFRMKVTGDMASGGGGRIYFGYIPTSKGEEMAVNVKLSDPRNTPAVAQDNEFTGTVSSVKKQGDKYVVNIVNATRTK